MVGNVFQLGPSAMRLFAGQNQIHDRLFLVPTRNADFIRSKLKWLSFDSLQSSLAVDMACWLSETVCNVRTEISITSVGFSYGEIPLFMKQFHQITMLELHNGSNVSLPSVLPKSLQSLTITPCWFPSESLTTFRTDNKESLSSLRILVVSAKQLFKILKEIPAFTKLSKLTILEPGSMKFLSYSTIEKKFPNLQVLECSDLCFRDPVSIKKDDDYFLRRLTLDGSNSGCLLALKTSSSHFMKMKFYKYFTKLQNLSLYFGTDKLLTSGSEDDDEDVLYNHEKLQVKVSPEETVVKVLSKLSFEKLRVATFFISRNEFSDNKFVAKYKRVKPKCMRQDTGQRSSILSLLELSKNILKELPDLEELRIIPYETCLYDDPHCVTIFEDWYKSNNAFLTARHNLNCFVFGTHKIDIYEQTDKKRVSMLQKTPAHNWYRNYKAVTYEDLEDYLED